MTLDDVAQTYGINVIKCVFNDATHPVFEQVDANDVVVITCSRDSSRSSKRQRAEDFSPARRFE